jgi:hypothetical protein
MNNYTNICALHIPVILFMWSVFIRSLFILSIFIRSLFIRLEYFYTVAKFIQSFFMVKTYRGQNLYLSKFIPLVMEAQQSLSLK